MEVIVAFHLRLLQLYDVILKIKIVWPPEIMSRQVKHAAVSGKRDRRGRQSDTDSDSSGDIRMLEKELLCGPRASEDRPEIVALSCLCILSMSDVILSRERLPFLDELCDIKCKDDQKKGRASILG